MLIRPSKDSLNSFNRTISSSFMFLGKFTSILTGFPFSPYSARFITSVSSILGLNPSLFHIGPHLGCLEISLGPLPFLQHHYPTLLSHLHHPHPRYGKGIVYPLRNQKKSYRAEHTQRNIS